MTSKTSTTAAQTSPKLPRGEKAGPAAPEVSFATPPDTTIRPSGSAANVNNANPGAEALLVEPPTGAPADPLNSGPTTGACIGQDRDSQKQGEATAPAAPDTKLDHMIDLLRRPEGATLAEMCAATGWQAHSVRGAMAGTLKRKGHAISSEKAGGARRYRIGTAA